MQHVSQHDFGEYLGIGNIKGEGLVEEHTVLLEAEKAKAERGQGCNAQHWASRAGIIGAKEGEKTLYKTRWFTLKSRIGVLTRHLCWLMMYS